MSMTVKEIAACVGVSRATVYRVMSGHPYVKPEIRKVVEEYIAKYGCSPNTMGKGLALKKQELKISIVVSDLEDEFYTDICSGAYEAYERIKDSGVAIEILEMHDGISGKETEAIRRAIQSRTSALAIAPIKTNEMTEASRELSEAGIPLVTFAADIDKEDRLFYVGHKNYQSGRTCGYMMDQYLSGKGKVLVLEALMNSDAHNQRHCGFRDYLAENSPHIQMVDYIDVKNDHEIAYRAVLSVLQQHPDLAGIYIVSRGISGAVRALKEKHLEKQVRVFAYDLTRETRQYLQDGSLDVVIQQDPVQQGRVIVETLYQYLINQQKPMNDSYCTDTVITVKEMLE